MKTGHLTHEEMQAWVLRGKEEDVREREDEVRVTEDEVREREDEVRVRVREDEVRVREDEVRVREDEVSKDLFADIGYHLSHCKACQEEVAAYRLMLPVLETMPVAAFDFDVAEMVLANLPERQVGVSVGMVIVYCMVGAGVLTGLGALYVLTKYLAFNLLTGVGTIVIISVLILHLREMIGQYQHQIRLLDHYHTN